MKTLLLILLTFCSITLFSQSVEYYYDNAGNRVQRKLCLTCRMANPNTATIDSLEKTASKLNANILPNPTNGNLSIQIKQEGQEENVFHLFVYDVYGREIINKKYYSTAFKVDISNEPSGIYFAKLISRNKVKEWELIKK